MDFLEWLNGVLDWLTANIGPWLIFVPLTAALISLLALTVSFSSRRIAKRSLAIAQAQEDRRAARVRLEVLEAGSWRTESGDRLIGVKVSVVNASDREGSIVSATLAVKYRDGDVGHELELRTAPLAEPALEPRLPLPATLKGNEAAEGWVGFRIRNGLLSGREVDSFTLTLHDSRDVTAASELQVVERGRA